MYVELRKREEMDMIMAETRKRKTRRGKKNSQKRSLYGPADESSYAEWCPDVLEPAKAKIRHSLRPVKSPKAPFNSNQFLMEDRGDLGMFRLSPSQTLEEVTFSESRGHDMSIDNDSHIEDASLSMYSEDGYYEPLWVTDTSDFMLKEFEKDYNAASVAAFELETSVNNQLHVFDNLSKEEIVRKYLDLDRRYSDRKNDRSKSSKSFKQTVADLMKENKRLLEDNKQLKSSIEMGSS